MAQNPMQDIIPKGRSIRNVPLPESRSKAAMDKERRKFDRREETLRKDIEAKQDAESKLREDIETETHELERDVEEREALVQARDEVAQARRRDAAKARVRRKALKFGGIAVGVIILAFVVIGFFRGATVTVTPRTYVGQVNADLAATAGPGSTGLSYQPVSLTENGNETVPASGTKQVSQKASGTIVVYNNYNAGSQTLIANTRFETPEGLVFRIAHSIVVPGKRGNTPGSVEATVYADQPGSQYNIGLKDFTIPGFKGDPRYAGFYARSKTVMSGGMLGTVPVVSANDRARAIADIENRLKADLVKQVAAKATADQIFYPTAYAIAFQDMPDASASSGQATITEQGTITAAFFDRRSLSSAIARSAVTGYGGESILIDNLDTLTFTPKTFTPADGKSVTFNVSGKASFEWLYDSAALKAALLGQPKSAVTSILQKFPMIQKADISIQPFWSGSFPNSIDKITVKKAS